MVTEIPDASRSHDDKEHRGIGAHPLPEGIREGLEIAHAVETAEVRESAIETRRRKRPLRRFEAELGKTNLRGVRVKLCARFVLGALEHTGRSVSGGDKNTLGCQPTGVLTGSTVELEDVAATGEEEGKPLPYEPAELAAEAGVGECLVVARRHFVEGGASRRDQVSISLRVSAMPSRPRAQLPPLFINRPRPVRFLEGD